MYRTFRISHFLFFSGNLLLLIFNAYLYHAIYFITLKYTKMQYQS